MRRVLRLIPLLPCPALACLALAGCDGALLNGLGQAMVMVAMVYLAVIALISLSVLSVLGLVLRRFLAGQPIGVPLRVGAALSLAVWGVVVGEFVWTSLVEGGRADPLTWALALSMALPLSLVVLAFSEPSASGSKAREATLGGVVLTVAIVAAVVSVGLWPWTESPVPPSGQVVEFVDGSGTTCVRTSLGEVACWGDNFSGQTGTGERPRELRRPSLVHELRVADHLEGTPLHFCAISERRLWCWGSNEERELSASLPEDLYQPTLIPELGEVAELGSFERSMWARELGGRLVGLGDGLCPKDAVRPCSLTTLPADTTQSVVGERFWCARRADGAVICGPLGEEPVPLQSKPLELDGQVMVVSALSALRDQVCGVLSDGDVLCWAPLDLLYGWERVPERVPGLHAVSGLDSSDDHLCALTRQGQVWCWGQGFRGQLGDGLATYRATPEPVVLPGPAVRLQLAEDESCAWLADERMFCWGQPPGAPDEAYTLCHDTWLGDLYCVATPAQVQILPFKN